MKEEAMFRTISARWLAMIGVAAVLAAPMAWAQSAPPVRVRGTIERIDGAIYVAKPPQRIPGLYRSTVFSTADSVASVAYRCPNSASNTQALTTI
jgi:hypothetical protein